MKIQYLAVIFLIIIIPMTLLLTMYNQAQINNLNLQLTYNSYLSDATHNAIKAFELNTVNNSFSEVADSLKRDVEAAVNVFLSSMAKSLGTSGATNESIAEYVPAILFTLYDGYYIYAPSYNEILGEKTVQKEAIDGTMQDVVIAVPKDELEPPQDKEEDFTHILKPYVYYTMRYVKNSSTDFIVNYTLDNYISIYGKINGDYVTKSGYLVQIDAVNKKLSNGVTIELDNKKILAVLKRDILSYVLSPSEISGLDTAGEIENAFNSRDLEEIKSIINFGADGSYRVSLISDMGTKLLDDILDGKYSGGNSKIDLADIPVAKIDEVFSSNGKSNIDDMDKVIDCFDVKYNNNVIEDEEAKSYYVKAFQFSNWVNATLANIEIQDARDAKGQIISDYEGNTANVLKTTGDNNPESLESVFSQHKIEVIKSSIQSNLTSAIARYNQSIFGLKHGYDLKMPVLNDLEWEAITNKVTMVTFMQGMIIGNKVFNDYAVVSSDTNKELVDENEIYYFNRNSSGTVYYHTYDCPNLKIEAEKADANIIGFKSAEFEMHKAKKEDDESDERQIKYQVGDELRRELFRTGFDDYGNEVISNTPIPPIITRLLADYDCIVNRNYEHVNEENINPKIELARMVAIARERNVHYKVNGYLDSYKIEYKSGNIILTPSTTEFINGEVKVSLSTDMGNIKYYYENDKNNIMDWPMTDGTFADVSVTRNNTLYVYSEDDPDIVRSITITNIDKSAPTNITITASNISSSSFDLTVGAKDGGGSGITKYIVYVKDAANEDYKPLEIPKYSSQETEKINISSRATKTTYNCYVEVYDAAGNVARSNTISVTTN